MRITVLFHCIHGCVVVAHRSYCHSICKKNIFYLLPFFTSFSPFVPCEKKHDTLPFHLHCSLLPRSNMYFRVSPFFVLAGAFSPGCVQQDCCWFLLLCTAFRTYVLSTACIYFHSCIYICESVCWIFLCFIDFVPLF